MFANTRIIAKHIWPGSLRFRLMLIVLLAIAPVAGARLWSASLERDRIIAKANEQASRIANNGVQTALDAVLEARNSLSILSNIPLLRDGGEAACSTQLASIVDALPWAVGVYAIDPTGTVMCSSDPKALGITIADRPYVQTALATRQFFAGDFIIGRMSRVPMIGSALPVYDSTGQLVRIFVATIATRWFDKIAADMVAANPGSTATLVDGNGIVLADAPLGGNENGKPLVSSSMVLELSRPDNVNFLAMGDDGLHRIFGAAKLPHSNARIIIGLSQEAVLSELAQKQREMWAELVVLSILLGSVVWVFGLRAIARPIDALLEHARRVSSGQLDARIKDGRWLWELSVLARSFNVMTARLERRNGQLHAVQQLLEEQSLTDYLTGIPNRRGFDIQMSAIWNRAAAQGSAVSVCMVDADQFKLFNDTYGHGAGDEALRSIADAIGRMAQDKGGYAARLGGEEFVLLFPSCEETEALAHADNLCAMVAAAGIHHGASVHGIVTASIGVATIQPSATTYVAALFAAADAALYAAKASGRNRAMGASRLGMLAALPGHEAFAAASAQKSQLRG